MGMVAGMKWIAKEGTGAGTQRRFLQFFMSRSGHRPTREIGILQEFKGAASAAVTRFGPDWVRQNVCGRPVGVWLLLICWLLPLFLTVGGAVRAILTQRGRTQFSRPHSK